MRHKRIASLLLAAITVAAFGQVVQFDFILFDDPQYVTENPQVQHGLTVDGLRWALTTTQEANWHPLTWVSHMLDWHIFAANPAGHHLTNLALHVLNALLVFRLLGAATGRIWPSWVVAALFAVHPLHTETVVWISQRKDLLCTLFGLLSMHYYVSYAKGGPRLSYVAVVVFFLMALLAKPMLVTLPILLWLLDYWPLRRLTFEAVAPDTANTGSKATGFAVGCIVEKIPLLFLAAISCVVTLLAQHLGGAIRSVDVISLGDRLSNALYAYAWYITKTVWPTDLCILYPHPSLPGGSPLSGLQIGSAALLLTTISCLVLWMRRHYLTVGWLWFIGTLLPVIGLIQVGYHGMADRYTYVPLIGLFVILAFGGAELVAKAKAHWPPLARALVASAAVLVIVSFIGTWRQARYWRNSVVLFEHALAQHETPVIHNNLANALKREGKINEAVDHYRQALALEPAFVLAHNNLATTLKWQGKLDDAIGHYREALRLHSEFAVGHINLGLALQLRGDLDQAIFHFRRCLQLDPQRVDAHCALGTALHIDGQHEEAARHLRLALERNPNSPWAQRLRRNLAEVEQQIADQPKPTAAVE